MLATVQEAGVGDARFYRVKLRGRCGPAGRQQRMQRRAEVPKPALQAGIACLFAAFCLSGVAEEDCAALPDPADRLACYDRQHVADPGQAEDSLPPPGKVLDEKKKPRPRPSDWLQKGDRTPVQATIVAIHSQDRQKMVLQLDNGEVWIQNSPRNLPFRAGNRVSIQQGIMGGYIIRNGQGVSSRFSLIKP